MNEQASPPAATGLQPFHALEILGRAKALEAAPQLREPIESAFSDLSAKEFAVLESVLRKLIVSLDKSPRALRAAA